MIKIDVIIVGAGASGIMCAREAARRGRSVIVLEHREKAGKKILVSGGGRCNFTNLDNDDSYYVSNNKHFCKSALQQYSANDFIYEVSQNGIEYFEKKEGQLFCKKSSKEIVALFIGELKKLKVETVYNASITNIKKEESFLIETTNGAYEANSLVIASGGLSFESIGASNFGHQIAKQFGHKIVNTRPGLVPLLISGMSELSGISLRAKISLGVEHIVDDLLFTHKGLSGPAILQISLYWKSGEAIYINFSPDINMGDELREMKKSKGRELVGTYLRKVFPRKFVDFWLKNKADFLTKRIAELSDKDIEKLASHFQRWEVTPSGTAGYQKAEVTIGGVSTDSISSKTMESKVCSGLFFAGEVLDVTGRLGGHNFQWAWSSGFVAGQNA